jgi:hypothetical protein
VTFLENRALFGNGILFLYSFDSKRSEDSLILGYIPPYERKLALGKQRNGNSERLLSLGRV